MRRTLVLLDVTAMANDGVCVAGIDAESRRQLRLADPQPNAALLAKLGGLAPLDVISVDVAAIKYARPPHTEDVSWLPASVRKSNPSSVPDALALAHGVTFDSLDEAFGAPMPREGNGNRCWAPGSGARSLACLRVQSVRFGMDATGKVRATICDRAGTYYHSVPFQDLRLREHAASCAACEGGILQNVRREFHSAQNCVVRIGLTRPFPADAPAPACWLQLTNLFPRPRAHFR